MHINRAHPFQSFPRTLAPAKPVARTSAADPAPSSPGAGEQESFLAHIQSAMPATAIRPATAPSAKTTPSATIAAADASPLEARDAATQAMLAALRSNDVTGYQQAAANFLAACPAGCTLPVWTRTITIDSSGNLINTNNAGVAFDGTVVSDNYTGYPGMTNPVAGQPNVADGTADSHGTALGTFRTT